MRHDSARHDSARRGGTGRGVNQRFWRYDTGQGIFGNNEIERMTASPGNVHLDGHGNLDITALATASPGRPAGSRPPALP